MTELSPETRFQVLLRENPQAAEAYKQELEGEIKRRLVAIREQSDRDRTHDLMLLALATVFMRGEQAAITTGYVLFTSEPLVELTRDPAEVSPPKCFDILLANEEKKSVIAIECRTAHATTSPGCYEGDVEAVWSKTDSLLNRRDYLSEQVGFNIDCVETVLCVENHQWVHAAGSIDRKERAEEGTARTAETAYRMKLWTWNKFKNMQLQLAAQIQRTDSFWNRHRSEQLSSLLTDGVELGDKEVNSPCFLNSPSWQQAASLGIYLGEKLQESSEDEPSVTSAGSLAFTLEEVKEFFSINLMHYAADTLAPPIAQSILSRLQDLNLIRQLEDLSYTLNISERSPDSISAKFREVFTEESARQGAEERAKRILVSRYAEKKPMLFRDT